MSSEAILEFFGGIDILGFEIGFRLLKIKLKIKTQSQTKEIFSADYGMSYACNVVDEGLYPSSTAEYQVHKLVHSFFGFVIFYN